MAPSQNPGSPPMFSTEARRLCWKLVWITLLWHLMSIVIYTGEARIALESPPPSSAQVPAPITGEKRNPHAVDPVLNGMPRNEFPQQRMGNKVGMYRPTFDASYYVGGGGFYDDTGLGEVRSLQDWEVEDYFILSTVEGNLQARDRKTGMPIWELYSDTPVVQTKYHRENITQIKNRIDDDDFVWIVEPTEDGVLFRYHPDSGLQRTEMTMKRLVERSPFSPEGSGRVFNAEKQTSTYAIDGRTGNVLRIYKTGGGAGMLVNNASCKPKEKDDLEEECETSDIDRTILVSRTEYTVSIEDVATNELLWTLKYAEWGPNNSDRDLAMQYKQPMDNRYIYGIHDGRILGFDRSKGDEPKFTHNLPAPVVRVFDVVKSVNPEKTAFLVLPQPVVAAESTTNDDKTYVGCTADGGWFALSETRYPFVSQGAGIANCYYRKPELFKMAPEERQKVLTGIHTTQFFQGARQVEGSQGQLALPAPTTPGGLGRPESSGTLQTVPSSSQALQELAMTNKWSIFLAFPFLFLVLYWGIGIVVPKDLLKKNWNIDGRGGPANGSGILLRENIQRPSGAGRQVLDKLPQLQTMPTPVLAREGLPTPQEELPPSVENGAFATQPQTSEQSSVPPMVPSNARIQQLAREIQEEEAAAQEMVKEREAVKEVTPPITKDVGEIPLAVVEAVVESVQEGNGLVKEVKLPQDVQQLPTPEATPTTTPRSTPAPETVTQEPVAVQTEIKTVRFEEGGKVPEVIEVAEDTEVPATPIAPVPKKKKAHRGQRGGKKKSKNKIQQEENDEIGRIVDRAKDIQPANKALEPDVKVINESGDIDSTIIRIDNLEVHQNSQSTLGLGSQGTVVFKGKFEGRAVAVKRMLRTFFDVAHREVKLLQDSDDHPNVIRYHCMKELDQFLYIALEQCRASLSDVIVEPRHQDLRSLLDPQQVLRQIVLGVNHLHQMKIVHRDLKPQNILVSEPKRFPRDPTKAQHPRIVISDFGLCKQLEANQSSFRATTAHAAGTSGWRAPELLMDDGSMDMRPFSSSVLSETSGGSSTETYLIDGVTNRRATRSIDVFSMGCVFFFVLTQGGHPFGPLKYMRELNVINAQYDLTPLEGLGVTGYLAKDLIQGMIERQPKDRPDTTKILMHPYFWTPERRLLFLIDSSDRFEKEKDMEKDPKYKSPYIPMLEHKGTEIVHGNWLKHLDKAFYDEVLGNKRRGYDGEKVLDLLRVIRNKRNHYQDMTAAAQASVGDLPVGYLNYFTTRFPDLFLHVYHTMIKTGFAQKDLKAYYTLSDS